MARTRWLSIPCRSSMLTTQYQKRTVSRVTEAICTGTYLHQFLLAWLKPGTGGYSGTLGWPPAVDPLRFGALSG